MVIVKFQIGDNSDNILHPFLMKSQAICIVVSYRMFIEIGILGTIYLCIYSYFASFFNLPWPTGAGTCGLIGAL
jgi:hypothetical protein